MRAVVYSKRGVCSIYSQTFVAREAARETLARYICDSLIIEYPVHIGGVGGETGKALKTRRRCNEEAAAAATTTLNDRGVVCEVVLVDVTAPSPPDLGADLFPPRAQRLANLAHGRAGILLQHLLAVLSGEDHV